MNDLQLVQEAINRAVASRKTTEGVIPDVVESLQSITYINWRIICFEEDTATVILRQPSCYETCGQLCPIAYRKEES